MSTQGFKCVWQISQTFGAISAGMILNNFPPRVKIELMINPT